MDRQAVFQMTDPCVELQKSQRSPQTTLISIQCTLLTVLSGVASSPFSDLVRSLPRDISHIAIDEARRHYLAFKRDDSFYGRYLVDAE
ncbi:hypothetical protein ARMGADRAFT_1091171 [Armillaria gallica]|uniref:Uncharacterized protein n=1 Tax=Armillaria gallica TaxID=47427 RepID=A0A2H3CZN3_ARMGA|nr:hypothetical protein ARMGADRAFT_1091171 [Armillaria gallica]